MYKAFQIGLLALDFAPGYKRMLGGALVVAASAAAAYNAFAAPALGLPIVSPDVVSMAKDTGIAVLGLGVATAAAR